VVEDDEAQRVSIAALVGTPDVVVTAVGSADAALEALGGRRFDCAIVDLGLPDLPGTDLIERIRSAPGGSDLPVVVYTGQDLSKTEEQRLKAIASTIIVKDIDSSEKLLRETALFLHRAIEGVPTDQRIIVPRQDDVALEGRKVLIIDDDMRNIFSLASALEQHGMEAVFAETGRDGIERLRTEPGIDAVLVDVMMPEMDGYETMRAIRQDPARRLLPLIAVTAKAMVGDREKCLAAGACDYVSKPVDVDQLLAVLRVQLGRARADGAEPAFPSAASGAYDA